MHGESGEAGRAGRAGRGAGPGWDVAFGLTAASAAAGRDRTGREQAAAKPSLDPARRKRLEEPQDSPELARPKPLRPQPRVPSPFAVTPDCRPRRIGL